MLETEKRFTVNYILSSKQKNLDLDNNFPRRKMLGDSKIKYPVYTEQPTDFHSMPRK